MKDWPNPAWACLLVLMACVIGIAALFSRSPNAVAVITMGTSIVTGAFGFIVGHAMGSAPAVAAAINNAAQAGPAAAPVTSEVIAATPKVP